METLEYFLHSYSFNESLHSNQTRKNDDDDDDEGSSAGDDPGEHEAFPAKIPRIGFQQQKQDLLVLLKAKPPRKGKLSLFLGQSVSQLVGRAEAAQYAKGPRESVNEVSDHIYGMMSVILGNLQLMVHVLPTREITQAFLDQELSKLATAAFPNQVQELYRTHYIRAARGLIPKILIDNDKVIIESSQLEPEGKEKEPSQLEPVGKARASREGEGDFNGRGYLVRRRRGLMLMLIYSLYLSIGSCE
ncbi:hypothetical protein ACET3Z_024791 [Daucus carota]